MAKSDLPRALLDSCAWLAVINGEATAPLVLPLLEGMDARRVVPVGSALLLAEVYRPAADAATHARRLAILQRFESPDFQLVDVGLLVAREAAQLRLAHGLKTPDAVHLATAKISKADWFITMDSKLGGIPSPLDGTQVFLLTADTPPSSLPWVLSVQEPLDDGSTGKQSHLRAKP